MDDNLTDQQRAEQVRNWLRDNGWYLLAGLVLGIGALFGWRQWDNMSSGRGEAASALFDELTAAVRVNRSSRAEELTEQITRDYAGTPYADQALLVMAKVKMDAAAPDEAVTFLERAMKDASSPEIGYIAQLRLGRVMIQQDRAAEALSLLKVPADSKFAPRFHEVRGDAYYALNQIEEARAEYKSALEGTDAASADQGFLQAKYDEVGGDGAAIQPAAAAGDVPAGGQ